MKALLFSDWCTVRGTLARILIVCLIVTSPMVFMTSTEGATAPGVFAASVITILIVFYAMLGLFGSDEQLGWEEARLALPFTKRQVVRARYAFLALMALASAMVGTLAGIATDLLLSATGMLIVPRSALEVAGAATGIATGGLAYLGIVMPLVFKMGMSRSRMFFSVAFLLPLLFNVGPVRQVAAGALNWLEATSVAIGSPAPLALAYAALCTVAYLVSMLISERIYAARDF